MLAKSINIIEDGNMACAGEGSLVKGDNHLLASGDRQSERAGGKGGRPSRAVPVPGTMRASDFTAL